MRKRKRLRIVKYKYRTQHDGTVTVRCPSDGHREPHDQTDYGGPSNYVGDETCDYNTCGHNEGFICAKCKKRWCYCYGSDGCCNELCDGCWAEIHKRNRVCLKSVNGERIGPGVKYSDPLPEMGRCVNARR